jgi:tRNA(fMet)-specific endonuclease VapC
MPGQTDPLDKRPAEVIEKFRQVKVGEIGVSTVTVSELQYGVAKSANQRKNEVRLDEFLAPLEILPYDQTAAKAYGHIRFQLEKRGQSIGPLDLLIAAHASSQNLILITNDEMEFSRIKNLKIENWAK